MAVIVAVRPHWAGDKTENSGPHPINNHINKQDTVPALISRTRDRSYHDIVQSLLISPRVANDPSVFEITEKAPTR